jgi:Bax protein
MSFRMKHLTKTAPFKLAPLFFAASITGLALISGCDQAENNDIAVQETTIKPAAPISVSEKKANFFAFLKPMIEQANGEVVKQREQLLAIEQAGELTAAQTEQLARLLKTYRVDSELPLAQQVSQLKIKVNTIPAALILAQAANESAWGTSRFAREGNNYFGQWCFSKGCGLVPKSRNAGANHEVARFDSALGSVKSYIRNLNSHPTYELLRTLRQEAINQGQAASGETLAQGLIGYSERGEEYVKEIQSMIRYNKLSRFDVTATENEASSAEKG